METTNFEKVLKENSLYELQIHILNDVNIEQKKKDNFLSYISNYMKDAK
jgi:hypothetical protein